VTSPAFGTGSDTGARELLDPHADASRDTTTSVEATATAPRHAGPGFLVMAPRNTISLLLWVEQRRQSAAVADSSCYSREIAY
jgi:hypothetical protein